MAAFAACGAMYRFGRSGAMRRSVQFYRSGKPANDRFKPFARRRHSVSTMPGFECLPTREARVFRIAVAVAFTGAIVLASSDADARGRFRMSSPSPKPAAAVPAAKPFAAPSQKSGATDGPKPFAAARPANPQPVGGGTFVVIGGGSRPAGAAPGQGAPQRALDDGSSGPLQYDPTLAAADDKAAEPKKAAAAATECAAPAQAVAAATLLPAKNQMAAGEQPKIEPANPRTNPALVPVKPKRQAPVMAAVCYVQRDGSCVPSY
jgi:hypothetical protein